MAFHTFSDASLSTIYEKGDSGGPLLIDGVQVGINSAAAGCADP